MCGICGFYLGHEEKIDNLVKRNNTIIYLESNNHRKKLYARQDETLVFPITI